MSYGASGFSRTFDVVRGVLLQADLRATIRATASDSLTSS
jgi:hypothetical protein